MCAAFPLPRSEFEATLLSSPLLTPAETEKTLRGFPEFRNLQLSAIHKYHILSEFRALPNGMYVEDHTQHTSSVRGFLTWEARAGFEASGPQAQFRGFTTLLQLLCRTQSLSEQTTHTSPYGGMSS